MKTYILDIEGNDLLRNVTTIHCAVATNVADPTDILVAQPGEVEYLIEYLIVTEATVVGHNMIGYDAPAILKVLGLEIDRSQIRDTLLIARLVHPDIGRRDAEIAKIRHERNQTALMPTRLHGSHSLEAWGYRLGIHKTEYDGGWDTYSDTMLAYCVDDTLSTLALWNHVMSKEPSAESLRLEHEVAWIIEAQTNHGVLFDVPAAETLLDTLRARRWELDEQLALAFPTEQYVHKRFTPKVNNKTRGYVKGVETVVYKQREFNPASRDQIAARLAAKYGWVPKAQTDTGKPKVDETVLAALVYPEAELLAERMLIGKRLGQLAEGRQAWLKCVDDETSRIHGRLNTNGAVTGRMTHYSPNMSQVPAVRSKYGTQMRALFTVPKGYKIVGCDASGLELRMLAHYLTIHDGGAYAAEVLEGDVHSHNQRAAGLPTRDAAKTFILNARMTLG